MTSIRHNQERFEAGETLLDAARACILAVGWRRTTLTDVARRAGVSRMTIYRRWRDTQALLADLMVREWSGVVHPAHLDTPAAGPPTEIADGVTRAVGALRDNELFRRIIEVDPELLLPYLLDRRGRTQDSMLALLETAIAQGQDEALVRGGDPVLLARAVLLATHGFALSASTMTGPGTSARELDLELRALVEGYLAP
jgi:AcrR family transcriptional regulator